MTSIFLTSSPFGPLDNSYEVEGLDPKNGFPDLVRERWKEDARVLIISAFPADIPANMEMRSNTAGRLSVPTTSSFWAEAMFPRKTPTLTGSACGT